ncbi:GNAT family N-acetyltransferase [Streptomyces sp. NPDC014864]|uniref:GNAT family N-acetyltransferase n=1 Tax=Streptomyces sp. NPDC014864 TaxID=3364924 RepID=UPI0036FFC9C8
MTPPPPLVREMTLADCGPVAEIRVRGWQTAYRGLVPQSHLDALSVERDAEVRRTLLTQDAGRAVNLVAVEAPPGPSGRSGKHGEILGWACHGPYREGEVHTEDAELYSLYVAPGHWSAGVGRALLRESTRRCAAAGHPRMLLWVLKENTRARRFYERAGFCPDGAEGSFEVDGVAVPEVRYARSLTTVG